MNRDFFNSVKALIACNEDLAAGRINEEDHRARREMHLVEALRHLGRSCGVALNPARLRFDAQGYMFCIAPPGQYLGEQMVAMLNIANPIIADGEKVALLPKSTWCKLHNKDAEELVLWINKEMLGQGRFFERTDIPA